MSFQEMLGGAAGGSPLFSTITRNIKSEGPPPVGMRGIAGPRGNVPGIVGPTAHAPRAVQPLGENTLKFNREDFKKLAEGWSKALEQRGAARQAEQANLWSSQMNDIYAREAYNAPAYETPEIDSSGLWSSYTNEYFNQWSSPYYAY